MLLRRFAWRALTILVTPVAILLAIGCAPGLIIEADPGFDHEALPGLKSLTGWRSVAILPFALIASALRAMNKFVIDPCFQRSGWDKTIQHPHASPSSGTRVRGQGGA